MKADFECYQLGIGDKGWFALTDDKGSTRNFKGIER